MSHSFIDPKNDYYNVNDDSDTTQKKIDPVAQLKWLNTPQVHGGWGLFNNQPAQMFAQDEEEQQQKPDEEKLMQGKAEDEELQMKEKPTEKQGSSGTQTSIPNDVRGKMESSFGTDFSGVNIHQNSDQASNIGALAYTQGNDVHFAPGQYNPGSQKGQELLGHELTHVVQQRQGRVKPTKQGKGLPVNDNPALEKEADVMGAKAAQGKMADVSGKGSGVQMKGDDDLPQQDISLRTAWGDLNEIGSAELRGVYYSGTYQRDGKSYYNDPQFIIIPSKEQWRDILKLGTYNWRRYIVGFLRAANEGIRNTPSGQKYFIANDGSPFYYCDAYDTSPIPEDKIIEFLEVLFNVDQDETEIDLPQNYNMEGGEFAMKQGQLFPELAEFIIKYENLLVKKQSMKTSDIMLEESGIERLVDQSVVSGVFSTVDNSVPKAIMDSSFANAFKETAFIIADIIDNDLLGKNAKFTWQNNALRNYAKLIGVTVNANKAIIDNVNAIRKATIGMVIDIAFAAIPGGKVAKALITAVKSPIKDIFKDLLSQSYGDLSSFIRDASDKFVDVSGIVHSELYSDKHNEISSDKKADIEQAINILINTFTSNLALYA